MSEGAAAPWIEADWPAPPGVRGFTTVRRGLGVSQAPFDSLNLGTLYGEQRDEPAAVLRNRELLAQAAALPSPPRWLHQVHGVGVVRFDGDAPAGEPEGDAAVTSTPGTVLAILTADCLPVLFAAEDGGEIGGAHAGWRGLADGMLEATVAAMRSEPARLRAWLGPAAGPQRYEIGAEVREAFLAVDAAAETAFVATKPGHWRVDLYALARQRLARAGVRADHIHGGGLCTISEPDRFYSHRRDRRTGRMATLIWMQR
ncbi:peptidoglycan editing factor PgeF [Lysobacter sp. K5869]|uniref:peptidoglycan editing factor PgeF n=1 Tax=Lysobacter sp. K5869 TaxID=2820808 RepID=UPI001C05FAE7|nr:peptidoglycan editing factor PgeF [Lysobacter sp. K5869]QWP78660.1 peptidoglycan editing factor PgeF [Lysobacter sp. K5869]